MRFDRLDGFGPAGTDEHPFAGRQPVGLDDDRHVFAIVEEVDGWSALRKTWYSAVGTSACGADPCKRPCSLPVRPPPCVGPKTRSPPSSKASTMPAASGASGPDDRQADLVLLGELDQAGAIVGGRMSTFSASRCGAGVARGHEHPLGAGTLRDLPSQGVLPPAVADDKHVHQITEPKMKAEG